MTTRQPLKIAVPNLDQFRMIADYNSPPKNQSTWWKHLVLVIRGLPGLCGLNFVIFHMWSIPNQKNQTTLFQFARLQICPQKTCSDFSVTLRHRWYHPLDLNMGNSRAAGGFFSGNPRRAPMMVINMGLWGLFFSMVNFFPQLAQRKTSANYRGPI